MWRKTRPEVGWPVLWGGEQRYASDGGNGVSSSQASWGHVSVGWGEGERSGEEWSEAGGFDAW